MTSDQSGGAGVLQRQPVSWRRLFVRHLLWVPLFVLTFAMVFGAIGVVTLQTERALARDGVDAVAVVTRRSSGTRSNSSGGQSTTYRVFYKFQPTSDQTVEGVIPVSRAYYNRVAVGDEVPIRYLPADPGTVALEPAQKMLPRIFMAVGGVALTVALGLGWYIFGNKLSVLRAARHGEVREAEVVSHTPTNTQINGRTQYRFDWIDAALQPGHSTMMDFQALPAVGSVVRVYVDPRTGRGWSELDF